MSPRASFGIIYGAEGADFPRVGESGPFATLREALDALDFDIALSLGGWMIVEEYVRSDGESITTAAGRVVKVSR